MRFIISRNERRLCEELDTSPSGMFDHNTLSKCIFQRVNRKTLRSGASVNWNDKSCIKNMKKKEKNQCSIESSGRPKNSHMHSGVSCQVWAIVYIFQLVHLDNVSVTSATLCGPPASQLSVVTLFLQRFLTSDEMFSSDEKVLPSVCSSVHSRAIIIVRTDFKAEIFLFRDEVSRWY